MEWAGRTGYWSVTVFQQIAAIGNNITIQIVAGLSMQVTPHQKNISIVHCSMQYLAFRITILQILCKKVMIAMKPSKPIP